eukprot:1690074-Pyramimonas_sp.AAC.1
MQCYRSSREERMGRGAGDGEENDRGDEEGWDGGAAAGGSNSRNKYMMMMVIMPLMIMTRMM